MDHEIFYTIREISLTIPLDNGVANLIFDTLELQPVAVNFTYGHGRAKQTLSSALLPDYHSFGGMKAGIQIISGFLNTLKRSPLRFNAFITKDVIANQQQLMNQLNAHYMRQALLGLHRIIGSAANEMLGNPASLLKNIGSGVSDFFYEPAKGAMVSPLSFGKVCFNFANM